MKTCPNCGEKVDADAKFCTYCGYRFVDQENSSSDQLKNQQPSTANHQEPNPTQQQWEERKQRAKNFSSNYFAWFMGTLKHPTTLQDTNKHFGLTSFIASFVLLAIIIFATIQNLMNAATGAVGAYGAFFNDQRVYEAAESAKMSLFFNFLILILLLLLSVMFVPYLSRKVTYGNGESFTSYLNGMASYSNLALVLEVIVVITSLLRIMSLSSIILIFIPVVYSVAMCVSVLNGEKPRYDRFYSLLITSIIDGFIVFIIFLIFYNSLLGLVNSIGSNY